jgi:hypothetical protein
VVLPPQINPNILVESHIFLNSGGETTNAIVMKFSHRLRRGSPVGIPLRHSLGVVCVGRLCLVTSLSWRAVVYSLDTITDG